MTVDSSRAAEISNAAETIAVANDEISTSDAITEAQELAEEIHLSANILLKRLLSYLSQLPELPPSICEEEDLEVETTGGKSICDATTGNNHANEATMLSRGLTLPISAVVWLSDQLEMLNRLPQQEEEEESSPGVERADNEIARTENCYCAYDLEPWLGSEVATSIRYRLNLLRFLLPRAQLIRLTRQTWPRRSTSENSTSFRCSVSSSKKRLRKWWQKSLRQRSSIPGADTGDDTMVTHATNFLRHAKRFENGATKSVNLSLTFPNATIVILESVPPSWIDIPNNSALQLINVKNAAIYDFQDFLPLSMPLHTPSPSSLTHLKLDNCSLGELTTGFSSTLAQLVNLEYLSLRRNQFHSAKTLLRGLRPLTRLRYLDASANRLVGCFGPYTNLCLGGQVRTLKLSDNLLETCRNSGLEKCYALRELWLDSNNIKDVVEVSGLARLPEIQCIALQRNPFSMKTKSGVKQSPALHPPSAISEHTNHDVGSQDNLFYDPDWKIKLWTWFHFERQVVTPLELPLLNKKTGLNPNGCNVDTICRMTKEEWDRIQEETYSAATNATSPLPASTSFSNTTCGGNTEEQLPRTKDSYSTARTSLIDVNPHDTTLSTPTSNCLNLRSTVLQNRRVTKKSKTRKAKIRSRNDKKTGINEFVLTSEIQNHNRRQNKNRKNKSSSKALAEEHVHSTLKDSSDDGIESSLKLTKEYFASLLADNKENPSTLVKDVSSEKETKASIHSVKKDQQLSFSLQDVLISMRHDHLPQCPSSIEGNETIIESSSSEEIKAFQDIQTEELLSPAFDTSITVDDVPSNPFLEGDVSQDECEKEVETEKKRRKDSNIHDGVGLMKLCADHNVTTLNSSEPLLPQSKEDRNVDKDVSENQTAICDESDTAQEALTKDQIFDTESKISSLNSSPKRSLQRSPRRSPRRPEKIDEERIFIKPKVASIKLNRMGNYKPFDALESNWDTIISKASENRIPDGILKSPIDQSSDDYDMNTNIFSDQATDLLPEVTNESTNPAQTSGSRSTNDPDAEQSVSSCNPLMSTLPDHIWQDDNSVLSSLGASRDEISGSLNKFQLAEENCSYDGPESSRGMKVVENLQLYFETFVFNTSMPDIPEDVLEDMEEDQDDWQLVAMYYPRIQLWPDDRRLLELERSRISSSINSADWTTNRERFLRVWEEDIVPCGKAALRRLPPNRRNRLGFHGDKLYQNADVDAYAECRKVLLCLSSKAFYVIPEKDEVTMAHQQQVKKRRFPLPLNRDDRFRDAPWPHAVARHYLTELEAICIGFEFQRLTLRFRNRSLPKSDPFVYVLLTGDKRASVRILQEIQKLAKDFSDSNALSNPKNSSSIDIENDSNNVLDSLNHLIIENTDSQEQTIGTIMHFQIVQQQWKHGNRGTVRRVCVITDTMILLLDEDYAADGHDLSTVTVEGKNMADARYRLVDQSALSLVSEVQAASADPRAITIMIKPSALSRTHRWRLICRDREGAERLVEDARKALDNM